ncbi:MAG: TadE/TadG family type IV pilus assembly protein [Pseudomonadota bacterium]
MSRFAKDKSGAISLNFVIMLPLFIIALGGAIDFTRAYSVREQTQNMVDAATLAATRMLALTPSSTDADIREIVEAHIDSADITAQPRLACSDPLIDADRVEVAVSVTIDCSMQTIFPISVSAFDFTNTATSDFEFDELDVAFMLDVSGSMGGSKIVALRNAVDTALDIFLNQSQSDVRIAFAPYSTALNAGSFAEEATGVAATNNCVTSRNGAERYTDAPPSTRKLERQATWCNPSTIVPLTDDRPTLDAAVQGLSTGGWTAGHLGIAWAWYMVSPRWEAFWPPLNAPRSGPNTRRAVIIMTDGIFNRNYGGPSSRVQARRVCDQMRAAGMLVFSVGFKVPNSEKKTLRDCATLPTYFFDSKNATQLENAYRSIAEELVSHNLTQ